MEMGMMLKVLAPGMKHAKKPDLCPQVLRVSSQFEECRCTSSEKQIIKLSLVLQSEGRKLVRQGEDDVKVRDGQQFRPALS